VSHYPSLYFPSSRFPFIQPSEGTRSLPPDGQKRGTSNDLYLQAVSSVNSIVDEPCASQEKGERGDDADKSWHGLPFRFRRARSSTSADHEEPENFINGVSNLETAGNMVFSFPRRSYIWVGPGFERCFGYEDFSVTSTILTV